MTRVEKAKETASLRFLGLWGALPNPNRAFFARHRVNLETALTDIASVPEVSATLIARKNAVLADPWEIVGDNTSHVQIVMDNFKEIDEVYIFNSILDALWHGYAVLDVPLVKKGSAWVYEDIQSLPPSWFAFDKKGHLIFDRNKDAEPVNLQVGDLNKEAELVQYFPTYTNPYGESQLAKVFWPATWLKGNFEYWASYISRFGDDSILVHTDGGNTSKKQELLQAVLNFRSTGGMVVEGTDTFELLNTNKSASSMLFRDFSQACRESISKVILGHASALDSTPGKLGNEESLALVREDIQAGDKRLIAGTLNSLIRHLALVNKWGDMPQFIWTPEAEDEKALIARDKELHAMGVRFTEEYLQKNYRLGKEDFSITDDAYAEPATDGRGSASITKASPSFSEAKPKKKRNKDIVELEELEYRGLKDFIKPFQGYNNKLLTGLKKAEYWEDAFSLLLTIPLENMGDNFHQDLLNAHILGRGQILDKVEELTKTGNFSEKYLDTKTTAWNWFTKKTSLTATDFDKLDDELKQYAFTVAGLEKTEHISAVAQKLSQAFDKGQSYTKFKKSLEGLGEEINSIAENRLKLVYQQNMFSAYSEARYKQMMEAVSILPNWEYVTVGDERVRDSHQNLNGVIKRYDDPFWNTFYPPNGFNCRCMVQVSTKEVSVKTPLVEHPPKGFNSNLAAHDKFIGEKLLKSYASLGELQVKLDTLKTKGQETARVSLIGNKQEILAKGNFKPELFKGDTLEELRTQAEEHLKKQGKEYLTIRDKNGNPVLIGKDMICHIVEDHDLLDAKNRLPYFKSIEKLISNAETVVEDIVRYADSGEIIFQRYYYTKVDNKTITVMAQWIRKEGKREISSIPAGATLIIQSRKVKQTGIQI